MEKDLPDVDLLSQVFPLKDKYSLIMFKPKILKQALSVILSKFLSNYLRLIGTYKSKKLEIEVRKLQFLEVRSSS